MREHVAFEALDRKVISGTRWWKGQYVTIAFCKNGENLNEAGTPKEESVLLMKAVEAESA